MSGVFAWLDRPAGLSRDASVTDASFASLAAFAAGRAGRSSDAPSVPPYVAEVRALWRATCDADGPARFSPVGARGSSCGAASTLEAVGLAEVRAYVTMGNPLRAALSLDRAERAPAARTSARRREAQAQIAQLAPIAKATLVRSVAGVPAQSSGGEPAWGPLAFEPNGKLLVKTRAGVVRVDPDQGDEAAAPDVAAWKSAVTAPDGSMTWIETYDPCDGLPLRATFEPADGQDVRDVALPVVPRIGARCVGSRGAAARATPIAWGTAGLEAIVEDQPVLVSSDLSRASALAQFLDQGVARGAPRSPDGKTYVVATGSGLMTWGRSRARLLRAQELDGTYEEQHDCVVSDDAVHVACVRAAAAWVGTWPAP